MPELTYLLGAESYSWPGTYRMLQVVCLGLAPWYASTRWSQRHQPWCYRLADYMAALFVLAVCVWARGCDQCHPELRNRMNTVCASLSNRRT